MNTKYDGNQVVRIDHGYKRKDIYGIDKEIKERKGTGNYDPERTKFNVELKDYSEKSLLESIYSNLNKQGVEIKRNNKNQNLLNGIVVTSGQEFFESFGMRFKDTERVYKDGKKKGQPIRVPNIKSKEDIPEAVMDYFQKSYDFLKDYVGEENVIYAAIHFDEDTPHMQFYFTPVVNEAEFKVFQKDENGNNITRDFIDKNGMKKKIPIQLKDDKGKPVKEIRKGKFLNHDAFWKQKGGKQSYAKLQDSFNEYITSKGFNLFRGEKGSNKLNLTKAEWELKEKQESINELEEKLKLTRDLCDNELSKYNKFKDIESEKVLTPLKHGLLGYNDNDINNLISFAKSKAQENIIQKSQLEETNKQIDSLLNENRQLKKENENYKNGKIVREKDEEIRILYDYINDLKDTILKWKSRCKNYAMAFLHTIKIPFFKHDLEVYHDDEIEEENEENYQTLDEYSIDINNEKNHDKDDEYIL